MSITIHHQPLVVRPTGDLDLESGDALEDLVVPLLGSGQQVVIDLSEVGFTDSSGLGALVSIHNAARDRGAVLVLTRPSRTVHQLLVLTGLAEFFTMRD